MGQKFRILSVDGGGLKGLIAIKILQAAEQYTSIAAGEGFDFFAGTSTGGLIVSALASGSAPGGAAYKLSQIEDLYLEVGQEIFHQGGLSYSSKDVEKFDHLLQRTFDARKLSETIRPVLVPTYDIDKNKLVMFKTRSALTSAAKDAMLTEVCRATTAIAPVFPVYKMNYNGRVLRCVDAGPFLKNPAISALAEVWKHRAYYGIEHMKEEDIVLFSVSTGSYRHRDCDWSTKISEVLGSQEMDMNYVQSQKLDLDFSKINYLRVDMNLGGSSFSLMQLLQWIDRIETLQKNKEFRKSVVDVLQY